MFVLDTHVVSELRKTRSGRADANVTAWARGVEAASLFVSAITLMELERDVLSIERRDAAQGALLRSWFERQVLPEFADRTLPIDAAVARRCAALHVPDRRGERDALIAATALVRRMTVVTRNVADFRSTGAAVLDPWKAARRGGVQSVRPSFTTRILYTSRTVAPRAPAVRWT